MRMRRPARAACSFVLCLIAAMSLADVYGGVATPIERTLISQPVVSWNVYSTGGDKIVGGEILLNGQPIETRYDPKTQRVEGQPAEPLTAGKYEVVARALFERGFSVKSTWSFEVVPEAKIGLPEPNAEQLAAIEAVNRLRAKLGLQPARPEPSLCAAAQKHTEYNDLNRTTGHFQRPGMAGFFGEGPGERLQAFGYVGDSYEAVCFGYKNLEARIQSLIDAPYHRLPFFQPGSPNIGAGSIGERITFEFEMGDQKDVSVYPAEGQRDVPIAWAKLERPDPLRIHAKRVGVPGYPITLAYYGKEVRLSEVQAELTSETGEAVSLLVNTPDNDTWLRNATILFPEKPLKAGTEYSVRVRALASDGLRIDKTWRFRTAG